MDLARLNGVHRSTFGSSDSNACFRTDEPRVSRPVAISTLHVASKKFATCGSVQVLIAPRERKPDPEAGILLAE